MYSLCNNKDIVPLHIQAAIQAIHIQAELASELTIRAITIKPAISSLSRTSRTLDGKGERREAESSGTEMKEGARGQRGKRD